MTTANFVEQLFTKFFGRSADLDGLGYWVKLIDGGVANAAQATQSFLDSAEYGGLVLPIARLYYAAFNRIPDAGGLAYWLGQAQKGATVQQIGADFVRSAEFQTLYGKNVVDANFVDLLYKNVLGRPADAGGKAYWVAQLGVSKQSRASVLANFSNSLEFITNKNPEIKIVVKYQALLGTTPTPAEISAGLHTDPLTLTTQIYASDKYSGVEAPHLNKQGVVVDGYISGATVFVDKNGNGVLDNNEISTVSDVQGNFSFKGVENYNGIITAQNGVDIATGQQQSGVLTAPSGSTVVNPLTTLLQKLVQATFLDVGALSTILANRLQLDGALDLTHFDPITAAVKPGASADAQAAALKVESTAAQINTLISQAAAFLHGAGLANAPAVAEQAAYDALVALLADRSQTSLLDLSSPTTIELVISNAAHLAGANTTQQAAVDLLVGQAGQIIGVFNHAIGSANDNSANALATLTMIDQIQLVAKNLLAGLADGVAHGDLSASTAAVATDAFTTALDAALLTLGPIVQDITAPTLMSSSPADNAAPVLASANLSLTFSEAVMAGSGNIVITNGPDTRSIAITDRSQVSISDKTITINPNADLMGGTSYHVLIDSGAVKDLVGNAYAGITDVTALNFTVPAASINLSGLTGQNGVRLNGVGPSAIAIASAGDVNGDGFDDVIIGASTPTNTGASYVLFGKATGFTASLNLASLNGRDGFLLTGVTAGDFAGAAVSRAGDINGDGFADLIVGATGADPGGKSYAGSSYIIFGKSAAFSPTLKLSTLDGKTGFRLDGANANDWVGASVGSAGDVNGDGFGDLIVGASNANDGAGTAYVVFGKAGGFAATMNVSTLTGVNGFQLPGLGVNDHTGTSVDGAGDLNGDGFDDIVIGAPGANRDAGVSYVVFGKANGFSASLDLAALDGVTGFRVEGAPGDSAGRSVSNAGDVNGDGFDDLLIGAWHADGSKGASYVVFGKVDGFDPVIKLASLDGGNGFKLTGNAALDLSGISVSSAGDVNGDGYADLIIGARDAVSHAGASYLVYGKAGGFTATIDLSALNGVNGVRLNGIAGDLAGGTVAGGDVNGDGFSDTIIGAQGTGATGSTYVVFGNNASNAVTFVGSGAADTLLGTAAAEGFVGGAGNDTITGGGGADVIHGGAGNDRIIVPDLLFQRIDGGGGTDTLALMGAGLDLVLADVHGKLRNIETIELTGSGDNSLHVTAAEVTSLSNSSNTLTVTGNAGDSLHLGATWVNDGIVSGLHKYHLGAAIVLVGIAVTVDFAP
jgi:methionine-rich copper-binding protein CopC